MLVPEVSPGKRVKFAVLFYFQRSRYHRFSSGSARCRHCYAERLRRRKRFHAPLRLPGLIISFRPRKWSAAYSPPSRLSQTPIRGKLSLPRIYNWHFNSLFSFGGPANVARTVRQYVRAGVAGMHIEDQVQTKRCGHLLGKQVVSREEFLTRIRAAVIARDSIPGGSDFVGTV